MDLDITWLFYLSLLVFTIIMVFCGIRHKIRLGDRAIGLLNNEQFNQFQIQKTRKVVLVSVAFLSIAVLFCITVSLLLFYILAIYNLYLSRI